MHVLKPPTRDSKPKGKRRTSVFSNKPIAPTKRPCFSTNEITKKRKNDPIEPSGEDVAKSETPLKSWLKKIEDRPGAQFAVEYLLRGTPYKGSSDFEDKDQIKDIGASWLRNEFKQDGEPKRVNGWWVASNELQLDNLLSAPLNKKNQRVWRPYDVPVDEIESIVRLVHEFNGNVLMSERLAKGSDKAKETARVEARLLRQQKSGIPEETEANKTELRFMGVQFDEEMSRISSSSPSLGPHCGISPAARLLRGIRLRLVTVAEANALKFSTSVKSVANLTASFNSVKHTTKPTANSGSFFFGTAAGNLKIPTDGLMKRLLEHMYDVDLGRIVKIKTEIFSKRETLCVNCLSVVLEQFSECSCCDGRVWEFCDVCRCALNAKQTCSCAVGHDTWQLSQNRARKSAESAAKLVSATESADLGEVWSTSQEHEVEEQKDDKNDLGAYFVF